ncbi:hypothetical protein EYF80_030095 [Liparis tanakae]|uniref:Uncharacterized protein n=1 Tax=Liparis tanakae TaxID=230148 RepID=A0A4Z2H4I1_9TELE|nr:hypothetical protein EYF80_030095 [Liparis tanakae]
METKPQEKQIYIRRNTLEPGAEPMEQAPERPSEAEITPITPGQHQQVEETGPASAGLEPRPVPTCHGMPPVGR